LPEFVRLTPNIGHAERDRRISGEYLNSMVALLLQRVAHRLLSLQRAMLIKIGAKFWRHGRHVSFELVSFSFQGPIF
jgi:hypothetical protein